MGAVMATDYEIAAHEHPALRDEANFMIFADLSTDGMSGRWEQLWARQLGETEFQLCCIPFFTYGLALGDRVITGPSGDKKYVIQSVASKSGHLVYRVWFGEAKNKKQAREDVERYARSRNWHFEWSSENLLAVDISSSQDEGEFLAFLEAQKEQGILVESGA